MRLTPEQVAEEKKYLSELKERVWFGEHGLTSVEQDLFDTIEALQAENEQLQARLAQYRDALIIANNYMPDIGHFCTCGQCKKCGTNINYADYGYCLKCARNIIDAALSDTPADYHNPADVEALIMAMEAIKAAWSDRSVNAALDKASEALTKIGKALGGKEDV